jgi:hypothetical protein
LAEKLTYSEAKMLVGLRNEFISIVDQFSHTPTSFSQWQRSFLFDLLEKAYKAGKRADDGRE